MSVKKTTQTTTDKILNSDIYDITAFVDDIKKKNIDGAENKETLTVGMYGYLGYQFSSLLQNAIVTASELSNEAIPTRAKFDRNVITHALSLGVEKVAGTPANMKVLMMFPEKALRANMINDVFTFHADTALNFDEFEFHTDYDIKIYYNRLTDSNNGSDRNYVYTAQYVMDVENPISDIENPYLPPLAIYAYVEDNMVVLSTNLHQVYYQEIEEKIVGTDEIANKTISFSFDNQMSHFFVTVEEGDGTEVTLIPVYDGLYSQEQVDQYYCYYQYINSNTIRIRFDPSSYQPETNSNVIIKLYTTSGADGNFEYSEENTIRLTSDEYTNLYTIIAQRGEDGSSGGLDRQTVEQLQHIIPKEALSRGSITTLSDLRNFFNSLNNETSVLHVFRKEDNILDRVYYTYNLMKDTELNIIPTNTIPIYMESNRADSKTGKVYLESGTPIFFYKYGSDANLSILQNNFVGYLQQKVYASYTTYSFYDGNGYTFYQGTPDKTSMDTWFDSYRESFDPELEIEGFTYDDPKPASSYDFYEKANVYFKMLYLDGMSIASSDPEITCEKWFYGTLNSCRLAKISQSIISAYTDFFSDEAQYGNGKQFEIEYTYTYNGLTVVTHYPKRLTDQQDPSDTSIRPDNEEPIRYDSDGNPVYATSVVFASNNLFNPTYITAINFYRPRHDMDYNGTYSDEEYEDQCMFSLPLEYTYDSDGKVTNINFELYYWLVTISFYDEDYEIQQSAVSHVQGVSRTFIVPGYLQDISSLDEDNRKSYAEIIYEISSSRIDGTGSLLMLESISTIDAYSYNGQGEYNFSNLDLAEGDLIRFMTYTRYGNNGEIDSIYTDPTTWQLGEVLSMEKNNGRITSIEVLVQDSELGEFVATWYKLPVPGVDDATNGKSMDSTCIVLIYKMTKFLYTTPLSIILKDDPTINTHRITASYYLDIIDETRYVEFKCINSKSPIQFILSSIHTYRSSYLSDNRYKYTISINITPNTGSIDVNMVNRTQVIGVLYKNGVPSIYSIADYDGDESPESLDYIPYKITLYTKPFSANSYEDSDSMPDIIDDNNCTYIGPEQLIKEIQSQYDENSATYDSNVIQDFFDQYKLYYADSRYSRPLSNDMSSIDDLDDCYVQSVYLDLNTELRIYILYKYDVQVLSNYFDDLANDYMSVNKNDTEPLCNVVNKDTIFKEAIETEEDDENHVSNYLLRDMVLTNVYDADDGINLLYDYSDIMNSYVTMIKTNDIFDISNTNEIESYIVNRVPCVRYFYWWNEDRVLEFLKEMKRKINYVLDAIDPLECTFGLDFKFFNTYGPANMYYLTDDDGDVSDLIDNVALTMTFRTKFYNEDSDADSIIPLIKDTIKDYLENLDSLDDIHFPNITTEIETEYSEYVIYFEFVSFNIYDANYQHIITNEDMEMLKNVPEFLHVDTNDYTGLPYINIRIMS